jgi:hypothetical protein
MATIRNFENKIDCQDVKALRNALPSYLGKSIRIQYTKPSGINSILLVDVDASGNVTESNGNRSALTFEEICSICFPEIAQNEISNTVSM